MVVNSSKGSRRSKQANDKNVSSARAGLNLSSEEFRREAHRQSKLVAESPSEADDMAFVESISEWNDE